MAQLPLTDTELLAVRVLLGLLPPGNEPVAQQDTDLFADVPERVGAPAPTDEVLVRLSAGTGAMVPLAALGALLAAGDLFDSVAPTTGTAGTKNQRYWHLREVQSGQPTRADLYVFNGTAWGQEIIGFVLDATGASAAPLVGLTLSAASVTLGTGVTLTATPTSATSVITSVTFYEDGQPISTVTAAPWQYNRVPTSTGQHVYSAVATDGAGKQGTSQTRTLQVAMPSNILPNVSLTAAPASINLGDSTTLTATASDPDGTIALLEIFADAGLNTRLAQGTTSPLTFVWTPTAGGTKQPVARATDNQGGVKVSLAATIQVQAPAPITPIFTFPAIGNQAAGGAAFAFGATSTSPMPITYASSAPTVVSVSGGQGTPVSAGTATITASQAAGNGYAAATATQTVTVTAAPVTPVYNATLSREVPNDPNGPDKGECTLALLDAYGTALFRFQAKPNGDPDGKRMDMYIGSSEVGAVDFPVGYVGDPCYLYLGSQIYKSAFTNGDATFTLL